MRVTVRDIIVNAMAEARLVNRNQPVPGNLFVDAFSLLKKRLDQYSNTNYLSFVRKELNFEAYKREMILGTVVYNPDKPTDVEIQETYQDRVYTSVGLVYFKKERQFYTCTGSSHGIVWTLREDIDFKDYFEIVPDIEVDNLQEVVRVYIGTHEVWDELRFVAYEDFYNYTNNYVYSVLPLDDEHVKLFVKSTFKNVKVIYNEAFDFGPDDELNIPRQFVTLFTTALVYDLACQFPRLGDSTVAMLKSRLDELEENVRRSSSVTKFIGRDLDSFRHSYRDGLSGAFLWR